MIFRNGAHLLNGSRSNGNNINAILRTNTHTQNIFYSKSSICFYKNRICTAAAIHGIAMEWAMCLWGSVICYLQVATTHGAMNPFIYVQWTKNITIFLHMLAHFFHSFSFFFVATFDQLNFSSISFSFSMLMFFLILGCVLLTTRRLILTSTKKTPLSLVYVSGTESKEKLKRPERREGRRKRLQKSKCDDAFCSTDYDLEFHIHSRKMRCNAMWQCRWRP